MTEIPWIIIAGILYGYMHEGKSYSSLLKFLLWGGVIALALTIIVALGITVLNPLIGIIAGTIGTIALIVVYVSIAIQLLIGTIIGDFIEKKI